jgi:S1-C subfamily serine protease
MSHADEYKQRLIDRVHSTFGGRPLATVFKDRKAIIGPEHFPGTDEGKLAQEALAALEQGDDPDPKGLAALELMIKLMRPAALVESGEVGDIDPEAAKAFPTWERFRTIIRPFLRSIGRINDAAGRGVGTGFLLDQSTVATNAHVVSFLSRGTMKLGQGQSTIDFQKEYRTFVEKPIDVLSVAGVDDENDLAMITIPPVDADSHRPLQTKEQQMPTDSPVVAIGYPFDDPTRNPLFISGIYNGIFGVKRAAPGKIISSTARVLTHDCSTLGGNSGSPVVSMEDGTLVGVHKEGLFMYANSAVPAKMLGSLYSTNG